MRVKPPALEANTIPLDYRGGDSLQFNFNIHMMLNFKFDPVNKGLGEKSNWYTCRTLFLFKYIIYSCDGLTFETSVEIVIC